MHLEAEELEPTGLVQPEPEQTLDTLFGVGVGVDGWGGLGLEGSGGTGDIGVGGR
jgi:hypothetical protein